ncbi:right-handed parallel beta-helix repeat-containing protein [Pedobacter panaciterrae]|uniref:Right-handed parallel beta-helix repeat-containing protein n=1 Tax=Pedobacter panaciterrae TaxID=363849 RepID=A0ABU8NWQ3_9SPHI
MRVIDSISLPNRTFRFKRMHSTFFSLIFIGCICLVLDSYGQQQFYTRKSVPSEYVSVSNELKKQAFDMTKVLPAGYVQNGGADYTQFLQTAIDKQSIVLMPAFPVLINENGLKLRDNSILIFQRNSRILVKPNKRKDYVIISIIDVANVKVYYPNIVGDRNKHLSKIGEWGMGISIRGSKNISIIGGQINNCWGDGIYVGNDNGVTSEAVSISYTRISNNRRNGISITSGRNITLDNLYVSNTNGTAPQSGIDIEPNNPSDIIENIKVNGIVTENNAGDGISVILSGLVPKNMTRSGIKKDVQITIADHIDVKSKSGMRINGRLKNPNSNNMILNGSINVINPKWYGQSDPMIFGPSKEREKVMEWGFIPKINISNPMIYDKGGKIVDKDNSFVEKVRLKNKNLKINQ